MKNFKKVLALVLVLATLMGFATVAGAEYKDEADISADYSEAIQVLELIETMEGYPDGTFGPKKTITREEAAKLIAIFDNKDSDISTYYTSINPFADEKGRWGESYVGYGYRAGIIAGMNATTYAPTANVTGTQFLKMALVTLGYDQEAEGFVGSSWAVNVLALARKLDLIDGLADGWKAEADLTREEAAQILLNTLKADTVEYAQEAKQVGFRPTRITEENGVKLDNDDIYWTWQGRVYLTVAGAVSTGDPLYKSFGLKVTKSTDDFWRPYTKWTKGDDSVEIMDTPKATFTTKFSACELLKELGVKEDDRKTQIAIDAYYHDGVGENRGLSNKSAKYSYELLSVLRDTSNDTKGKSLKSATGAYVWNAKTDSFEWDKDAETVTWQHATANCQVAKDTKEAAQGVLTQVFEVGKQDGVKHYIVVSIETWLGKVTKVTKQVNSRDGHVRTDEAVEFKAFAHDYKTTGGEMQQNDYKYCWDGSNGRHCQWLKNDYINKNKNLTYDDPTGLAKDDYVLFTYSWRDSYESGEGGEGSVQSVDVTEGKEGRLNGHKFGSVATPSETRVDGEYIKDSVHFHEGYNKSKSNDFGTYTFYYDAYGNVIGMTDGSDLSSYAVLDKLYVTFTDGVAGLIADVAGIDGTVTKKVTVKNVEATTYNDYKAFLPSGYTVNLADTASWAFGDGRANGSNFKDFFTVNDRAGRKVKVYDNLYKVVANADGEYELKEDTATYTQTGETSANVDKVMAKVVTGKPYVELYSYASGATELIKKFKTNAETQYLIRTGDVGEGEYVAYTGYNNVKSVEATGFDVVMDDTNDYAKVVYLYGTAAFTDSKVTAYVPDWANMWYEEVKDGVNYCVMTVYIDGVEKQLYVEKATMDYFDNVQNKADKTIAGFYKFQYIDIGEVTTARLVTTEDSSGDTVADRDFKLFNELTVKDYNGDVLELASGSVFYKTGDTDETSDTQMGLAPECKFYSIQKNGTVAEEDADYALANVEEGAKIHVDFNDNNDAKVNKITAIYVVEQYD